jgi:ComF family protein
MIPLKGNQFCPYCENRITPSGFTCFDCKTKYSIDGLLVACSYQNPLVAKLIHCYKYKFAKELKEPLGKIIIEALMTSHVPLPEIITSVPLHKRRIRWRGFNQSDLLAEYLSQKIAPGLPIDWESQLIERIRHTKPQMGIKNSSARRKNIENSFKLSRGFSKKIKNKRILLVDDVATTGATIFECGKILKKAGAKEIFAVVIARQEWK